MTTKEKLERAGAFVEERLECDEKLIKLSDAIAILEEREIEIYETYSEIVRQIPMNWLDPLLSGENAIGIPDDAHKAVEAILTAVKDRIVFVISGKTIEEKK